MTTGTLLQVDGPHFHVRAVALLLGRHLGSIYVLATPAIVHRSSTITKRNRLPGECVIADTTIGCVAEATRCAEKFAREGVEVRHIHFRYGGDAFSESWVFSS